MPNFGNDGLTIGCGESAIFEAFACQRATEAQCTSRPKAGTFTPGSEIEYLPTARHTPLQQLLGRSVAHASKARTAL